MKTGAKEIQQVNPGGLDILDLHLSISNDIVSTRIYDKRDDFDFEIVNFSFWMMMFLSLHPMKSISIN